MKFKIKTHGTVAILLIFLGIQDEILKVIF